MRLRLLGVVPKIGGERFLLLVLYFDTFRIDVKDTSLTHQGDLEDL
jgi:hypothetical protein